MNSINSMQLNPPHPTKKGFWMWNQFYSRLLIWKSGSRIAPPVFYVLIGERERLKELKICLCPKSRTLLVQILKQIKPTPWQCPKIENNHQFGSYSDIFDLHRRCGFWPGEGIPPKKLSFGYCPRCPRPLIRNFSLKNSVNINKITSGWM